MTEPIHIISLGAGVQSSTMALMAAAGEIGPMPYCAIFADTQDEPAGVYTWLDWLEKQLPFKVNRISKGSLSAVCLIVRDKKDGTGKWAKTAVPAFIKNPDGSRGITQRQCTYDYKVVPLTREALRIAAIMQHGQSPLSVSQWIGISLDEAHRMKPSRDVRIQNRWPLIDARMTRNDCLRWMESRGFPIPPRSACVYCPFHSDTEWRRLRDDDPVSFAKAVKFDADYRATKSATKSATTNINGLPYLHSSLVPLSQVDFSTDEDRGQETMNFGNECEGLCGV